MMCGIVGTTSSLSIEPTRIAVGSIHNMFV